MTEARVRGAFRSQGESCAMLGSPFMGRLMPLIGARLTRATAVGARVLDWSGDVGPAGQSVPLRLAGALHGLVLDGADAGLIAAYPPNEVDDDALWRGVEAALIAHETRLMDWLDRAPQTNEVRRSAALLPALWWLVARHDLPVVLSELGASAGLNLWLDRFDLLGPWGVAGPGDSPVRLSPDWRGVRPVPRAVRVADRAGVDRHPLAPHDPAHALRLLAFLWPDQPERLALTRGAMALSDAVPDTGDAAPWLAARLATPRPGRLHVVYSTVAWQYFPPETQAACRAALEAASAQATPEAPLAHVAFEADGRRDGAPITVTLWPAPSDGPATRVLGRADFHGRWVEWRE